jgi:transposase-like protein
MENFTKEQRDIYVESGGVKCPLCDSTDIEGFDIDINEGVAMQEMLCHSCDAAWVDIYHLHDIDLNRR